MARGVCLVFMVLVAAVYVDGQGILPGINNVCFEPKESGICRAFIPAFYFNPLTGACDCFVYGGCRGNNNRFATLNACMGTCSVRPELQFNTPACDRILGQSNPLASVQFSPHQTVEVRQPQSEPQTQTESQPQPETESTGNQLPISLPSQPKTEEGETAAPQSETGDAPTPQSEAPAPQSETGDAPSPQAEAAEAPQKEAPSTVQSSTAEESDSESSSSGGNGGSSSSSSRTIASLVIGSTGVRPGTLTIGQPVFIPFFSKTAKEEEKEE